ncbi:MAG: Rrf2 family transcriptional regulator [Puniceicoccales bacterium]|jgi:Rrf2 family protein|nr:Rrf2 family transcriptional regulator [Puniceicoccales bacterium]
MKISLKLEYACRVLAYMGRLYDGGSQLAHIEILAQAEDVPRNYLVQILNSLRNGGLLNSRRGKQGGYTLARPPTEITLYEIVAIIDPDMLEIRASRKGESSVAVNEVWASFSASVNETLQKTTLASLIPRYATALYDI